MRGDCLRKLHKSRFRGGSFERGKGCSSRKSGSAPAPASFGRIEQFVSERGCEKGRRCGVFGGLQDRGKRLQVAGARQWTKQEERECTGVASQVARDGL